MKKQIYGWAIVFAVAFAFAHFISLPIGVTYDGFQYLDGADVLGSSRFPEEWWRNRTPLYSLVLKLSFSLFGKQALAAVLVSTAMGLGTVLLLGRAARIMAGEWCGAIVLVFLSLFPTGVAYQHLILTETGSSFFIALLISVALLQPKTERAAWRQALLFSGVLAIGYYWRQLLLDLAPLAALVWIVSNWRFVRPGASWRQLRWDRIGLAVVLVVAAPIFVSHFWDPFADRAGLAEVTMRQSIVRQALLAPSDPVIGEHKAEYIQAVRESSKDGNFFSGVRNDLFDPLLDHLFGARPVGTGDTRRIFISGVLHYPSRYLGGVFRTAALFMGARATVNENRIFREQILSPTWTGAKIGDGPPKVQAGIKEQFRQLTTSSAILQVLWRLSSVYDLLLMVANVAAAVAIPYAVLTRNYKLFAMAAFPVVYLALYAAILASIDRFAVPAYPATLTILVVFPALVWERLRNSRGPRLVGSAERAQVVTEHPS